MFVMEINCFNFAICVKVIGIRPMTPVLNKVHLKVSEQEMLRVLATKEII